MASHTPLAQCVFEVQETPSSQSVPSASCASAGHVLAEPSQSSAASHSCPTLRQTVPLARTPSDGQAAEEPVHRSAASQSPSAARHT
jgi:hypothetical protein